MNNRVKITQDLKDIPELDYQGYVWLDNSEKPVLDSFPVDLIKNGEFIIEAYLYNQDKQTSVTIKHIDGVHYICIFELNQLTQDDIHEKYYIANREISKQKSDYKYLKFVEYWEADPDTYCNDMSVKKLEWNAFAGFIKEVKNDEK